MCFSQKLVDFNTKILCKYIDKYQKRIPPFCMVRMECLSVHNDPTSQLQQYLSIMYLEKILGKNPLNIFGQRVMSGVTYVSCQILGKNS